MNETDKQEVVSIAKSTAEGIVNRNTKWYIGTGVTILTVLILFFFNVNSFMSRMEERDKNRGEKLDQFIAETKQFQKDISEEHEEDKEEIDAKLGKTADIQLQVLSEIKRQNPEFQIIDITPRGGVIGGGSGYGTN